MTAIITGPRAYYNEFEPYAAAWLRNLIAAGIIAPGEVDERSIVDVQADDLMGFSQCHFFAGIGVWSFAMRRAGWRDDRPGWTASLPCQPFSSAGKGAGFDDERHLYPVFGELVRKRRPARILGEQVASKDADAWVDAVHADMETMDYAFGCVPFPSAGVGAPHIRDRNYWIAVALGDAERARLEGHRRHGAGSDEPGRLAAQQDGPVGAAGASGIMAHAHAHVQRQHGWRPGEASDGRNAARVEPERLCDAGGMADTERTRVCRQPGSVDSTQAGAGNREHMHDSLASSDTVRAGPTNGFWSDADWLGCTDGKFRPVEPGTFPLVASPAAGVGRSRADWHAAAGKEGFGHRAGRLKGYGNAINAEAARIFIEIAMEYQP